MFCLYGDVRVKSSSFPKFSFAFSFPKSSCWKQNYFFLKLHWHFCQKSIVGLERWLSSYVHWLLFQKAWVQFLASSWLLTTGCNSISRGIWRPLLAPSGTAGTWCADLHAGKIPMNIKFKIKKKSVWVFCWIFDPLIYVSIFRTVTCCGFIIRFRLESTIGPTLWRFSMLFGLFQVCTVTSQTPVRALIEWPQCSHQFRETLHFNNIESSKLWRWCFLIHFSLLGHGLYLEMHMSYTYFKTYSKRKQETKGHRMFVKYECHKQYNNSKHLDR